MWSIVGGLLVACAGPAATDVESAEERIGVSTTTIPILVGAGGPIRTTITDTDPVSPTTSAVSTTSTATPTTSGAPGPTTTGRIDVSPGGAPGLAPTDPYVGVLGRLGPAEPVTASVVDPPPTTEDGIAPLTGLPADPARLDRPALVVKIDNAPAARPQSGLTEADIVVEELVEGGATRLAAVLHSRDADVVGPVRSFRSTDIGILLGLGRPAFAWSGANAVFAALLADTPVIDRGSSVTRGYWRSTGRRAPHNLYSSTAALWRGVEGDAPPTAFVFRGTALPGKEQVIGPVGESVDEITVDFGNTAVRWVWDGSVFARYHGTRVHSSVDGPVTAKNVVIQLVEYVDTGLTDSSGAPVVEGVSVGSGRAVILTDGRRIEATWTRPTLAGVTTFTDADDRHVELTPGTTWVLLAPLDALG